MTVPDDPIPPPDDPVEPASTRPKPPPLSARARRRALWTIGSLAGIILLVALIANLWNAPQVTDSQKLPKPPIASQSTPSNALDEVRGWFAPWQTAVDGSGSAQTIVMLRSTGSLEVSSYAIAPSDWPTDSLHDLDIQADGDQVLLRTSSGKTYAVGSGQPFILDARPNQVYLVKTSPEGFTVHSQTTAWVHAHAKPGK